MAVTSLAHSETLTPEQLSLQVRLLSEQSRKTAETLTGVQQTLQKMNRLLDNPAILGLIRDLEDLSSEVSQLRGELEQQDHGLAEIKKQQRELYLDVDRRLRDLENRSSTKTPVIESTTENVNAANPAAIASAKKSENTQAPVSEQSAYQVAFDILKEGRYQKAIAEFRNFLQIYPNSNFASNAQYWLGEAQYVSRHFDQAIIEFERVLAHYPGSAKVADAMLKLGYTYYEKKQYNKAKTILIELMKDYPKSTAASLAAKRLERIRKRGQ